MLLTCSRDTQIGTDITKAKQQFAVHTVEEKDISYLEEVKPYNSSTVHIATFVNFKQ